ncbi:MAG: ATP-binding cassette domain-containing protein [Ruminococcaceae bacterium]|nr:ATP-binding cassette domain-containing protein [Oscillospiraceae bacterium]
MALLTLKDIGKIYVSENNVTVGIRGVNLSFDRGEFVAITGKSGSGKSTLLNVISGMDSYEEGELFIEGAPTSHYLQPEWEDYREKYISFIFQDYNIIESLTVLQNVELALMYMEDPKERRKRALELLDRVGLSSHIRQKGSKLSGGQKQRTVIARALAKDSPIILADEPTGNLDSATSKEIISLLREVSKDKLLIVVTHNFEQVEDCATRHIRVFDGAVESDARLIPVSEVFEEEKPRLERSAPKSAKAKKKNLKKKDFKNGFLLGRTIFAAKPRLSFFLCLLMLIGTLGIFGVTALCGSMGDIFEPNYMFHHMDGRVVLTTQSGEVLSEEEWRALAEKHGAKSILRFDSLLDSYATTGILYHYDGYDRYISLNSVFGKDYGTPDVGTYPKEKNEILLYLPISCQPAFGKDTLLMETVEKGNLTLKVTGVKYYYDNNLTPECLFTEDGFRTATALHYLLDRSSFTATLSLQSEANGMAQTHVLYDISPSFDIPANKVYLSESMYREFAAQYPDYTLGMTMSAYYFEYNFNNYNEKPKELVFRKVLEPSQISSDPSYAGEYGQYSNTLIVSDDILVEMAETVLERSYRQVSFFFENDREARRAAEALREEGYIAVPSDTEYTPDPFSVIENMLACIFMGALWLIAVFFLAFFIHLCSVRSLGAFKGDMAIMRSMGIPVRVIRIGMYVRMMISLIPAFICLALSSVLIFTSPTFNQYFVYLYGWQYAAIVFGMILLTVRITRKQVRKLFCESVKKSLKGGNAQ